MIRKFSSRLGTPRPSVQLRPSHVPMFMIALLLLGSLASGTATVQAQGAAGATTAPATAVNSTSATQTATITIVNSGIAASINVLTMGVSNLDYRFVSGGTCATGTPLTAPTTCTVEYTFTPSYPGQRKGAITITDSGGTILGTTYVSGIGNGPQILFPGNTSQTDLTGSISFFSFGLDGSGNLFTVQNSSIIEYTAASNYTSSITVISGLRYPSSPVFDGAGNLFLRTLLDVREYFASTGFTTYQTLSSGGIFIAPDWLAVDGAGNVFWTDIYNHHVRENTAASGYTTCAYLGNVTGPTQNGPYFQAISQIAVDASSNVFLIDKYQGNYYLEEIPAAGGYSSIVELVDVGAHAYGGPLAVDAAGDVFFSSGYGLYMSPESSGYSQVIQVSDNSFPVGNNLIFDANGNLYTGYSAILRVNIASPGTVTFPSTPVYQTSAAQTVNILNSGTTPLIFSVPGSGINPALSGPYTLGLSGTCPEISPSGNPQSLASGSACTEVLTFSPTNVSTTNTGALAYTDNDLASSTQSIALTGVSTGTSTATSLSLNPSSGVTPGQTVQLSATVAPTAATGSVIFYDSGVAISSAQAVNGGSATFSVTNIAAGTHQFTAVFTGTGAFGSSTSSAQSLTVSSVTQPTIQWSAPSPITYGTTLSSVLNAVAVSSGNSVPGTYAYTATPGGSVIGSTILGTGTYTLSVQFTPTNTSAYASASGSVQLQVNQATPSITWPTPAAIPYGTQLGASQLDATLSAAGNCVYTPAAGTVLAVGPHTLSVTCTPTDTTDYTTPTSTVQLTVNPATPSLTFTSSANPVLTTNPITLTATVSSAIATPTGTVTFYNGSTALGSAVPLNGSGVATLTISTLPIGSNSLTAVYSGNSNFTPLTSAPVAETVEDFNLQITTSSSSTTSVAVFPGATAKYLLTVSPVAPATTFPVVINLSASGLPPGATYTLSPPSLAAGSGSTTVTLSIVTAINSAANHGSPLVASPARTLAPLMLSLLLLPFARRMRRTGERLGQAITMLLVLAAGLLVTSVLSGCSTSTGFFAQAPQSYTITVTGTSGVLTHSTNVTLTVE